jgi:hypothetical protein
MRDPGRHARLAHEPRRRVWIRRVLAQDLERHAPAQPLVDGEVDDTHAALAETTLDAIRADPVGGVRLFGCGSRRLLAGQIDDGGRQEPVHVRLQGEERLDLATQLHIAVARAVEKSGSLLHRARQRLVKERIHPPPVRGQVLNYQLT